MRAAFGLVSLLVVLAIIGLIASRQMRPAPLVDPAALRAAGLAAPQAPASGTPEQQGLQLQKQIANDLGKAMDQGAARLDQADKP